MVQRLKPNFLEETRAFRYQATYVCKPRVLAASSTFTEKRKGRNAGGDGGQQRRERKCIEEQYALDHVQSPLLVPKRECHADGLRLGAKLT